MLSHEITTLSAKHPGGHRNVDPKNTLRQLIQRLHMYDHMNHGYFRLQLVFLKNFYIHLYSSVQFAIIYF